MIYCVKVFLNHNKSLFLFIINIKYCKISSNLEKFVTRVHFLLLLRGEGGVNPIPRINTNPFSPHSNQHVMYARWFWKNTAKKFKSAF